MRTRRIPSHLRTFGRAVRGIRRHPVGTPGSVVAIDALVGFKSQHQRLRAYEAAYKAGPQPLGAIRTNPHRLMARVARVEERLS